LDIPGYVGSGGELDCADVVHAYWDGGERFEEDPEEGGEVDGGLGGGFSEAVSFGWSGGGGEDVVEKGG